MRSIPSRTLMTSDDHVRLNAAGRLETAAESLHLLLAENLDEALPLAHHLRRRKGGVRFAGLWNAANEACRARLERDHRD